MHIVRKPTEIEVRTLLASAGLPVDDVAPAQMEHFFGAWTDSTLKGVVGVELHGSVALLRSLAVVAPKRGSGLGSSLLAAAEQYAAEKGVHSIFLLTTTAQAYFAKRGYSLLSRAAAPEAIRNTTEFASICPASAVLMVKHLPANPSPNPARRGGTPLAS